MLHYSLWEMPMRGRTVTRNLNRKFCFLFIWSGRPLFVWTLMSQSVSGRLGGLPLGAILLPFVIPSRLLDMAVGWTCIRLAPAT